MRGFFSLSSVLQFCLMISSSQWVFGNSDSLEPMIIVEKKTEYPLSLSSPWVYRISSDEWESRQQDSVAEILRTIPGMLIVKSGQAGAQTSLYSRGSQSDHTVFLLEGRKLNGGFSGLYNLGQLRVGDYSSIEVMRGPSTLQYGGEGIGAAVSLRSVNLKNQQSTDGGFVLEGGTFDTARASLSQQMSGESWGLGWNGNIFSTENERPNAGYQSSGGTVSLQKDIFEGLTFDFVGTAFKSDLNLPGPSYAPTNLDYQDSYNYLISPGFAMGDDLWEVKVHYAYAEDWLDSYSNGIWGSYQTVGKAEQHQTEIFYKFTSSEFLNWRAGFSYLSESFEMREDAVIDQNRNTKSIHGSVDWLLNESIEWTAGIRVEEHSFYDDSPVIASLSGKWRINELVSLHGRWSNGFSPPTGNDLYFPGSGNPDLKPEETETKEIGLSISGDESKNFGKITFFESDIEELIEFGAPNTNIGKVRIKGVEMSAEANIWASLQGFLSWTILEAKNLASGEDFLDRRAENSGTIGLEWRKSGSNIGVSSTVRKDLMERDFSSWPAAWVSGEDYWVTRIYGSKAIGSGFKIFGRVENLFDKEYEEVHGYPAQGRGAYGGISYSF